MSGKTSPTPPILNITEDDDEIDRSEMLPENLMALATEGLALALQYPGPHEKPLTTLEEVDVVLVSDATIATVHGEFMDDPTPTDVITFHHGEILVSTETAETAATEYKHPAGRETLLYIIHGFLHLNGHHDSETDDREDMHRIQDSILDKLWPLTAQQS